MTSALVRLSEGESAAVAPWVVAVITFSILMILLGLVWSFRHSVAPRARRDDDSAGH